ncbi:MAG: archaellin/type IV pilin N-terminal domain-containing protein [Nanobdellota archaeon]
MKRKQAIMGIGTLIIFIATILVAAVAAGVLISTSGVLQQRALITGQEARKKITNAVEIISITAYGDKSDESINNFEILLRLDAGSDPLQMKYFDLSFIGPNQHSSGKLSHPSLNDAQFEVTSGEGGFIKNVSVVGNKIDNTSTYEIFDLDGDSAPEDIRLISNEGEDQLLINFSRYKEGTATVDLEEDLSNFTEHIDYELVDQPIRNDETLETYGFMNIVANLSENSTIPLTGKNYLNGTNHVQISKNYVHECTFESIPYETKFCYEVMNGDDDTVLSDGEVFMVKYKLKPENRLFIRQSFEFLLSGEQGRMTRAKARTPDIIETLRVPLWPVG